MKNYLLLALFGAFLFTSCKKDKKAEELILGTWDLTSVITDGEEGIGTFTFSGYSYTTTGTIQFNSSNAVTITLLESETVNGATQTYTNVVVGTYTLGDDGNSLTMNFTDSGDIIDITGSFNTLEEKTFDFSGITTYDNDPSDTESVVIKASKQ